MDLVCGDNWTNSGYDSKALGDYPIQVGEVVGIREADLTTIQKRLSNVIIKSGSQLGVSTIIGDITALTQILILFRTLGFWLKLLKN